MAPACSPLAAVDALELLPTPNTNLSLRSGVPLEPSQIFQLLNASASAILPFHIMIPPTGTNAFVTAVSSLPTFIVLSSNASFGNLYAMLSNPYYVT